MKRLVLAGRNAVLLYFFGYGVLSMVGRLHKLEPVVQILDWVARWFLYNDINFATSLLFRCVFKEQTVGHTSVVGVKSFPATIGIINITWQGPDDGFNVKMKPDERNIVTQQVSI